MRNFLNDLVTFILFVAAIICFYFSATVAFSSALLNFILFFSAIFFIIQAAGLIDKAKGFGKYSEPSEDNESLKNEKNNNEEF